MHGSGVYQPYPLLMQQRLTRLTGFMYVTPQRLYFICASNKGGLAVAIGRGIGGAIGGLVAAAGIKGGGEAGPMDEPSLHRAALENAGSLIMEPSQIKAIKDTFWTHGLWYDGKTYALPNRLSKELKDELARWCHANNVKHAGLVKA